VVDVLPVANGPSAIWEDSFKTSSYFRHISFVQCLEVNHNANCLANLSCSGCDSRFGSGREGIATRGLLKGGALASAHSV